MGGDCSSEEAVYRHFRSQFPAEWGDAPRFRRLLFLAMIGGIRLASDYEYLAHTDVFHGGFRQHQAAIQSTDLQTMPSARRRLHRRLKRRTAGSR